MAKYRVTDPTGRAFDVTAPDEATPDEVLNYAKTNFGKTTSEPSVAPPNFKLIDTVTAPGGEVTGVAGLAPEPGFTPIPETPTGSLGEPRTTAEAAKRALATGAATAPNYFKQFLYTSQLTSLHQQATELQWRQSQYPDADFSAERQSLMEATDRTHKSFEENKRPIDIANEFVAEATPEEANIGQKAVISFAQSAPTLVAGLAAGTLFGPAIGVAVGAGGGALIQAGQTAGEAADKGAGPDVAFGSALTNGMLEGFGEFIGLGKVFEASKGGLVRLAKAVGYEATQEGVTQFLQDVVSKISYDPTLSPQEMGHNAAVAFLAGAMGGGFGTAHQAVVGGAHQFASDVIERFTKPPELTALEGAHAEGTLQLGELKAKRAELEQRLVDYGAAFDPNIMRDQDTEAKLANVSDILNTERYETLHQSQDSTLRMIGVLASQGRHPREALVQYEQDLRARLFEGLPALLDQRQLPGAGLINLYPNEPIFVDSGVTEKGLLVPGTSFVENPHLGKVLYQTADFIRPAFQRLGELLQIWSSKFDPSLRFILTDAPTLRPTWGSNNRGSVTWADRENGDVAIIAVNPALLAGTEKGDALLIAHELGHAVISRMFANSPKGVQDALLRAWKEDVAHAVKNNMTLAQFEAATAVPMGRALGQTTMKDLFRFYGGSFGNYARYFSNFAEWSAHQFERALASDYKGMSSDVKEWVAKSLAALKSLYKNFVAPTEPNMTFKEFIEYHLTDQAVKRQQARLAEIEGDIKLGAWMLPRDAAIDTLTEAQTRNLIIPGDESNGPADPPAPGSFSRRLTSFLRNYFKKDVDTSDFQGGLDKFNRFKQLTASLLYIAQQNRHIRQLYDPLGTADPQTGRVKYGYVNLVEFWHQAKMKRMAGANDTLKLWDKLRSEEVDSLNKFMLDQVLERKFYDALDPNVVAKYKLTDNVVGMFNRLRADFVEVVDSLEKILLEEAQVRLMGNPTSGVQLNEIRTRMQELRAKPYFPLTRFGKYVTLVRAGKDTTVDGQSYKKGEVIYREHFDTKVEQAAAHDALKGRWTGHEIKTDVVSEAVRSFGAIPREVLENMKSRLDLTEDQRAELNKYLLELAPAQSYSKHLMQRRGIQGFSWDLKRAYANYMMQASNYLARIQYAQSMREAIQTLQATATAITGDSRVRREIANYVARHYDYVMAPENDWAALRGAVSVAYLGFMIKSALVNLLQVPMVSYPHLGAIHGDGKALSHLAKAYGDVTRMYHQLRPLNETEQGITEKWLQGAQLSPQETQFVEKWTGLKVDEYDALNKWLEERAALQEAKQQGFIDEAFAMELAGLAHGGMMSKLTATTRTGKLVRQFSHVAMMPFEVAERMNRRVTFIAAYRLAKESGLDNNRAFVQAKEAVRQTQFEYAKFNRPELMRGKKGVLFMFMQYQLSMLYFLGGGDKGWWRAMAMLLLAGGPLGLPGVRNIMDVIEAVMTKIHPNLKVDLEHELRELLLAVVDSPDVFMHGASRYGFGLLWWADLSGSVSMGRIIPGTDVMKHLAEGQDFNAAVRDAVAEAGGATSTLAMRMLQAASSNDPDVWRNIERGMPLTAGQQVMTALRWFNRGGETDTKGAATARLDPNDPYQAAELAGKALGFNPREVNQAKEAQRLRQDFINYYLVRRKLLLGSLNFAITQEDMGARETALDAIRTYNEEVPYKLMTIKGKDIQTSIHEHVKARLLQEATGTSQKRGLEISQELQ